MQKFSDNIVLLRDFKGLKQSEVADNIGVSRSVWSDWERNRSEPDLERFLRIVEFFQVPMDWLFFEKAYLTGILEELKKEGKSIPKCIPNGIPNEAFLLKVEEPQAVYNRVQKEEIVSNLREVIETQKAHIASLNTTIQLLQEKINKGN